MLKMRQSATLRQIEMMINFMERHRDLALGRVRTKEARAIATKLWMKLARILNSQSADPTAFKTAKGWNLFYNDYKRKVKNKIRRYMEQPSLDPDGLQLTVLEGKLYDIMGPYWCVPEGQNPLGGVEAVEIDQEREPSSPIQDDDIEVKVQVQSVEDDGTPFQIHSIPLRKEAPPVASSSKLKRPHSEESKDSDNEETVNVLADIERDKLKLAREQLKVQKERNDIERSKVHAINNLAGAAWAIVNVFNSTNGKKAKRNRRDDDDEDNEESS